ncbi:hypothetical protein DM860_008825 [Cuscuta australis]|uniref:DUF1685 domain-containing protein n=1 Tax=Cuscuta australis TaxID=267555 RepID=A0A328DCM5_9ASTE|nr:hypothetical protein DM860_008825 [Cuscuta australis]
MGAEEGEQYLPTLLSLFDSFWFEQQILTSRNSATATKPQEGSPKNKISRIPTSMPRSFSDKCLTSKDCLDSEEPSPMSVLLEPKQLQPILSGKEFSGNNDLGFKNRESCRRRTVMARRKNSTARNSKSLSDLEFKELKGFMDLGFVFSDEDRESELVSIIPGLQKKGVSESGQISDVSRPYLSEAWDAMEEEERDIGSGLGNWRVPAFGNEMEIKKHLRFWAYAVASNVR